MLNANPTLTRCYKVNARAPTFLEIRELAVATDVDLLVLRSMSPDLIHFHPAGHSSHPAL